MPATTVVYTNRPDSVSGPLSLRRGGVSRFVLPDLQGHARQLTDSAGPAIRRQEERRLNNTDAGDRRTHPPPGTGE